MRVELDLKGSQFWPRCFLNSERYCGDRDPNDARGWHVADMCETPSCPLRCAVRDALADYKRAV